MPMPHLDARENEDEEDPPATPDNDPTHGVATAEVWLQLHAAAIRSGKAPGLDGLSLDILR